MYSSVFLLFSFFLINLSRNRLSKHTKILKTTKLKHPEAKTSPHKKSVTKASTGTTVTDPGVLSYARISDDTHWLNKMLGQAKKRET